jgi:hypothetical protein
MSHVAVSFDEAAVSAHLERFLGSCSSVLRGMATPLLPHVYFYEPTDQRSFGTLVTAGLSGFSMPYPEGEPQLARAELMTYVPASWRPPVLSGNDPSIDWPITMLRLIVGYAISENAFLGNLHTLPNLASNPPGLPYVHGSELTSAILLPPVQESRGFDDLMIRGERVRFLHVLPLTTAECELKIKLGFRDALAPLLESGAIPIVADARRRSAVG